jgi:hypothetical protein
MKNRICPFLAAGVLRGGSYDLAELTEVAQCVGDACMLWHPTGTSATRSGRCALSSAAHSLTKLETKTAT